MLKYQISWKSVQWEPRCSKRTDGRTDMRLIVAFLNSVTAPKTLPITVHINEITFYVWQLQTSPVWWPAYWHLPPSPDMLLIWLLGGTLQNHSVQFSITAHSYIDTRANRKYPQRRTAMSNCKVTDVLKDCGNFDASVYTVEYGRTLQYSATPLWESPISLVKFKRFMATDSKHQQTLHP